ncbi:ABC transporter substrate-binding protein [Thermophilibacter mediterraneus]|uniref:ABC transporter substrate-binding protein n=1 Tax=Thermophilibacter mediterraneus TaxID=1871031 RepID=UPI00320AD6AE
MKNSVTATGGISRRSFLGMLGMAGFACAAGLGLTGCEDSAAPATEAVDYNSMSLDDIIAQAKEEGQINSVGMPDTWANWVGTWDDIEEKYGIAQADQDMSSAEEIAMFKQEGTDGTKDIGDVGQQWGPTAEAEGVTLKYKTSYWDEIPDWAKDDDGDWVVGYYGTMSIISNDDQVPNPPTTLAELADGDYKVSIGDITAAAAAQHAVLAIAVALGGGLDDMQPAYDFITKIAEAGRLDVSDVSVARLESGEVAVGLNWDYNSLNYRAQIVENNPDAKFTVSIPTDGSVQSGYATIINVNAPHPAAACLAREYILSDEGQINLARGFATPIRSSVELPEDVKALRLPEEQYGDQVQSIDYDKWTDVTNELVTWYQENIIPILG